MKERILIVEDETAIQSILSELLTDAGYSVELASDGLDGFNKFRKGGFSLVILDIMLPKIDGYTVCEMLRQDSNVPIIMLTALDEEQAQIKAFELKADDYITKPFSLKLVLMRVEAVLRRISKPLNNDGQTVHTWRNIRLDSAAHSVYVGETTVLLTQIEFSLTELFLKYPNRVFTRDNLLNNVWGCDFFGDEKTVNIHIMNIRRKVGADIIETIRGVGYRLGKEN